MIKGFYCDIFSIMFMETVKKILGNKKTKDVLFFLLFTVVAMSALGIVYVKGFEKGLSSTRNVVVHGVTEEGEVPADFAIFWDSWNLLKSKFVDSGMVSNNKDLMYGAISGMFASTGDPHTVFFPPTEAYKFGEDISGEFQGIGAEIGKDKENNLVIIAPLKSTPAYNAGVKAGDYILKIDGESTAGITVDEAVNKIRGPKGTIVVLTMFRDDWDDAKDIEIERGTIEIPTLDYKMIDFDVDGTTDTPNIAYIKLYNFYQKSPLLFYRTELSLVNSSPGGIILDLRDNPGGYLDAAISISGWFVEKDKTIVTEKFQNEENNKVFKSQGPGLLKDIPVVVLINKGSASASEITAGALKQENNATIIGETSFGKGTVQEVENLSDGSMVKITIAHWLTPDGQSIEGNGIEPDIEVEQNGEDVYGLGNENIEGDKVILKALEILKNNN